MTGRTHDLAAFTALGFVVVTQSVHHITLATALVALVSNLIGGIAPDIDQPTAPFWRNLPVGGVIGRIFDPLLGGHRFISHSLCGAIIFGGAWYYLLNVLKPSFPHLDMVIVWWAFMIGFLSHLFMDSLTREGVPFFLPIPWKFGFPPLKSLRISTGGLIERFIIFPGLFIINCYFYYLHYPVILHFLKSLVK